MINLHRVLQFELSRRAWWERRGEHPIAMTGSRQHYRRGTYCWNGSHCYRITRCVRAADHHGFEVWGREIRRTTFP